jgi:tetratricopeptide (TPR) repeat protein
MIDTAQQHIATLEKRVGTDAKSPLFAQLADYYLEGSRAQEALRICDAGLANFPFYTTGHLMKGKALAALNMKAEARREFEFVLDFLPHNETIIKLLAQMPLTAEETLVLTPQEPPHKIIAPEPVRKALAPELPPPSAADYTFPVSTAPEVSQSPEPTFGFDGFETVAPVQQPEQPPVTLPPQNFFEELTQAPPAPPGEGTINFGLNAPTVEEQDTFKTSPFSEFNFPQPELLIKAEPPTPSTDLFGGFEFTPPAPDSSLLMTSAPPEEESFEHYTSRRTKDLTGENTVSLEDYLSNKPSISSQEITPPVTDLPTPGLQEFTLPITDLPSSGPQDFTLPVTDTPTTTPQEFTLPVTDFPSTGIQNKIEELTNKLQNAGKITPIINFAQKETPAASEQDTPAGMGFVTPTLAEIYAKQGWFDDAIKAYRTLARNKPAEKERFEKRIAELEELKKKGGG